MPNLSIEIHDSVLGSVSDSEKFRELRFSSVYIHQSEGRPGIDQGIGWFQEAVLCIFDSQSHGKLPELPIEFGDGQTILGADVFENEIPLPLDFLGKFELRLIPMWQPDEILLFTGSGAKLNLIGQPGEIKKFLPR
jgi:hypothetical protein